MKHRSLRIYIASPYSAGTERERAKNVEAAIDAALALFQKGHFPYVPHLTDLVDKRAKEKDVHLVWEDYMKWHRPWLTACDGFLCLGSSKGTDLELQIAKDLDKSIFHSVDAVPKLSTL